MQSLPDTYRIPQWPADARLPQTWPQQQPQIPMIVQPIQQQPQQLQPLQQDILESQIREQQQKSDWSIHPVISPQVNNHPVDNPILLPKSKGQSDNSQESEDESEYDEDEKAVQVTEPPPKKKQRKHKKQENKTNKVNKDKAKSKHNNEQDHDKPQHEQLKMIKSDLDMEFIDHDGAADRPGGAVLSLTLGKLAIFRCASCASVM